MMSLNLPANNGYPERKIENGKQGKQYEETVQTPKKKRRKMGRNLKLILLEKFIFILY